MTDQYNMDQYNKETSQIHAPADLIRRTKEAVREEEQRIAGERQQQNAVAQPKHSHAKVYRWALPVAAAVLCVILYNISGMMPGRNMSGGGSGAAADMDSEAAQLNNSDLGTQSGGTDMSEGAEAADTTAAESVIEDSEYEIAATDTAEEEDVSEDCVDEQLADAGGSAESGVFADSSVENGIRGGSKPERGKNSYIESIYGTNLWIEEVEEVPSAYFYTNTDTESVIIHGEVLYVAQDLDNTWIGYVEIDGQKYVVRGELTKEDISWKEFAEEACKLLEDTVYSIR